MVSFQDFKHRLSPTYWLHPWDVGAIARHDRLARLNCRTTGSQRVVGYRPTLSLSPFGLAGLKDTYPLSFNQQAIKSAGPGYRPIRRHVGDWR